MRFPPLLYYPDFYPDAAWLRAVLLLNDEVCRIVPNDVQLDDPESLRQIEGELGALTRISPEYVHTEPYTIAAEWLDRTFQLISSELHAGKDSRRLQISISDGKTNYGGNVLVYDQKLSRRMRELLVKHDLVDPTLQELVAGLNGDVKGLMIPTAAANAVLSFIADTIAREKGFTAITNQPLEFAMNTLLGLNVPVRPPSGAHEGVLAGVYASVLIPKEIGDIPFSDYKILRERSTDVRIAFARFVQDCSRTGRLQGIESTTTLQQRIADSGRELEREFKKFQSGGAKALRLVREWWPFTVTGVLAIAKDVVPPQWALAFGVAAQIAKFAHQATLPSADRTKETVFNLAAGLGGDIRALPRIPELLATARD